MNGNGTFSSISGSSCCKQTHCHTLCIDRNLSLLYHDCGRATKQLSWHGCTQAQLCLLKEHIVQSRGDPDLPWAKQLVLRRVNGVNIQWSIMHVESSEMTVRENDLLHLVCFKPIKFVEGRLPGALLGIRTQNSNNLTLKASQALSSRVCLELYDSMYYTVHLVTKPTIIVTIYVYDACTNVCLDNTLFVWDGVIESDNNGALK